MLGLGHLISFSVALVLGFIPSAPLVLRLKIQTELHFQFPQVFTLYMADHGSSQAPESYEPIPHNKWSVYLFLSIHTHTHNIIFLRIIYYLKVKSESEVTQACPTFCDPMDCSLPRLHHTWDFPGKNTGVGCHFLLQGIFPIQGLNLGLLHCRQMLYHLSHQRSHILLINLNISYINHNKIIS